jgi:hypothetical protein
MNALLEAIQNTRLADWVRVSEWGYPIILTLHSVGLAMVVGTLFVIDLRLLGVAKSLPMRALKPLMLLVWLGFTLNLLTGLALFTADADKFYHSPAFRLKICSVIVGVALAVYLNAKAIGAIDGAPTTIAAGTAGVPGAAGRAWMAVNDGAVPRAAKLLACASILVWLAAISLGRYVAYE